MTRQPFTASIRECPRCGSEHLDVHAAPFARPPVMDDGFWTHWVMCPKTSEPVMLAKQSRTFTVMCEGGVYVMKPTD